MLIPKAKPLVVPVPRESNFRIPEGRYRAKITSVRKMPVERMDGASEVLRLLFEVQVPSLPNTQNLAKAEYRLEMNPGSDLRNVLTRLLGKQVFADASGGTLDLAQLISMDVEVEIEHVTTNRRDEYSYPLVRVRDIRKPSPIVEAKPEPKKEAETEVQAKWRRSPNPRRKLKRRFRRRNEHGSESGQK